MPQKWMPFEIKNPCSDCIIFAGKVNSAGYGYIYTGLGKILAHRLAYQLANPLNFSQRLMVLHHCDNPRCINPKHLYQGTRRQNSIDQREHGAYAKGSSDCPEGITQLLQAMEGEWLP